MKVVVLGAGIVGVTTAYFLGKDGHDVTVIDREPQSARECSYANGGQLSYSHAEPWSNPAMLKKAITWLGKDDAPLLFRFRADYQMWKWALKYVFNSTAAKAQKHLEIILALDLYSRQMMHQIVADTKIEFDYIQQGIIHTFRNPKNLDAEIEIAKIQADLGAPYEKWTVEECVAREPALAHMAKEMCGGAFFPFDESGDVCAFAQNLIAYCQENYGTKILYETIIENMIVNKGSISSIRTNKGEITADAYVVSIGSYSSLLLRKVGIDVPIYPLKGYSISVPVEDEGKTPRLSITNQCERLVYSRLGNVLRVAGTAEMAGYDDSVNAVRVNMLKKAVNDHFPGCGDVEKATEWACLRPSTPDGPPIIGKTKYDNLYLNTGQGSLGWTQCAGSGRIAADIIEGREPEMDISGLIIDRYRC